MVLAATAVCCNTSRVGRPNRQERATTRRCVWESLFLRKPKQSFSIFELYQIDIKVPIRNPVDLYFWRLYPQESYFLSEWRIYTHNKTSQRLVSFGIRRYSSIFEKAVRSPFHCCWPTPGKLERSLSHFPKAGAAPLCTTQQQLQQQFSSSTLQRRNFFSTSTFLGNCLAPFKTFEFVPFLQCIYATVMSSFLIRRMPKT